MGATEVVKLLKSAVVKRLVTVLRNDINTQQKFLSFNKLNDVKLFVSDEAKVVAENTQPCQLLTNKERDRLIQKQEKHKNARVLPQYFTERDLNKVIGNSKNISDIVMNTMKEIQSTELMNKWQELVTQNQVEAAARKEKKKVFKTNKK